MNFFAKTNISIIFITENNNNNNNIETTDMCLLSNITEIEEPVPDPVFVTPEVVHIEATLRVSVDYKNEMETKEEKDEISDCDESAAATTVAMSNVSNMKLCSQHEMEREFLKSDAPNTSDSAVAKGIVSNFTEIEAGFVQEVSDTIESFEGTYPASNDTETETRVRIHLFSSEVNNCLENEQGEKQIHKRKKTSEERKFSECLEGKTDPNERNNNNCVRSIRINNKTLNEIAMDEANINDEGRNEIEMNIDNTSRSVSHVMDNTNAFESKNVISEDDKINCFVSAQLCNGCDANECTLQDDCVGTKESTVAEAGMEMDVEVTNSDNRNKNQSTSSELSSRLTALANTCIAYHEVQNKNTIRSDKETFVRNYMQPVITHQLKLNFFDVSPEILNMEKDIEENCVVPEEERHLYDWCFSCLTRMKEGEEVAVCTGCRRPHSCHIECFYEYFCGVHTRPNGISTNDTLAIVPPCPQCFNKRIYPWKTWYYSSTNVRNWKKGSFLPNNFKNVFGIHFHEREGHKFAHFITNHSLLYSIKVHLGIKENFTMRRPATLLDSETKRIFSEYNNATRDKFQCKQCNMMQENWKQCFLDGCISECEYRICRGCVITRVDAEYFSDTEYKVKGILPCPECNKFGRCIYKCTKTFCFGLWKKGSNNMKKKKY